MLSSHFHISLNYFTILVRIQNAENKTKSKKILSNLFFLWLLSAVVIIHKCYRTYCEFRLKMHFVPCNMLRKSPQAVCRKKGCSCVSPFRKNFFFVRICNSDDFSNQAHDEALKQCNFHHQIEYCANGPMLHCIISKAKLIRVIY